MFQTSGKMGEFSTSTAQLLMRLKNKILIFQPMLLLVQEASVYDKNNPFLSLMTSRNSILSVMLPTFQKLLHPLKMFNYYLILLHTI